MQSLWEKLVFLFLNAENVPWNKNNDGIFWNIIQYYLLSSLSNIADMS